MFSVVAKGPKLAMSTGPRLGCYATGLTFFILTEGGTDKNHPGQSLPDKRPLDKNPANN